MVLDMPGKLFGQQDVRETPAAAGAFSFDTDDFTNTADLISLKNKTSYWSCAGVGFTTVLPDVDDLEFTDGELKASQDIVRALASVNLPNGAVVTGAIVYGSISDETWELFRKALSDGTKSSMAGATNFNSEDTSISNATIDNSTYSYFIRTSTIDTGDIIYGARITYTTDYI